MKRQRHAPEQVIRKLRVAEQMLSEGKTAGEAAKALEVSEQTLHRWRNQYGGMKAADVKRLKELPSIPARSSTSGDLRVEPSTIADPAADVAGLQMEALRKHEHRHVGPQAPAPRLSRLRRVAFVGSYLWHLRQAVGSDLVLMPGAMVALLREDRRVLLTRRTDDGTWCLPGGSAEPGGSFAQTAIDELAEETGLGVCERDLVPFGSLSEAEAHTIRHRSGDVTHWFALLFLARRWTGQLDPDPEEVVEAEFSDLATPPSPIHPPTAHALELLTAFLPSGRFQLR